MQMYKVISKTKKWEYRVILTACAIITVNDFQWITFSPSICNITQPYSKHKH